MCWHCRNAPKLPHPMAPSRVKEAAQVESELKTSKKAKTEWDPDRAAPANSPAQSVPAKEMANLYCQCKSGCEKLISRPGGKYAWGHTPKRVPKKILARLAGESRASKTSAQDLDTHVDHAAKHTPPSPPATASSNGHASGVTIETLTRAQYEEKYGAATRWVSEEMEKVRKSLDGANFGDVVVVAPSPTDKSKNATEAVKNLRDRIYRGFKLATGLKYKVKCAQVVRAGHVLVEKVKA